VERIEQLLREELRRTDAAGLAGADVMLARVARVRRRRTATIGAAAGVAAVLAGAALIWPLNAGGRTPTGAGAEPPAPIYRNELLRVLFTGDSHGYVLQRRCARTFLGGTAFAGERAWPSVRACGAQLLATADGGRSWQPRNLPADPGGPDQTRDPSGRSLAFWLVDATTLAIAGHDDRHWTSRDGGVTWTQGGRRDEGPAGAAGVVGPDERPVFLAPPAGGLRPGTEGVNPLAAATDGSFWRACTDRACAEVTRTFGATWERKLPGTGAEPVDWVTSYNGETVYACLGPALMRSSDGGASWTQAARRVSSQRSTAGVVMPDGDLVLTEGRDGRLFRLASGATALERLPDLPFPATYLYRSGDWLVASPGHEQREGDPDLGSIVMVSPDNGTTWRAVPAPDTP
jgi:hypothetical protein